jgi:hypothetical protein
LYEIKFWVFKSGMKMMKKGRRWKMMIEEEDEDE